MNFEEFLVLWYENVLLSGVTFEIFCEISEGAAYILVYEEEVRSGATNFVISGQYNLLIRISVNEGQSQISKEIKLARKTAQHIHHIR
jgi:hypothetical protein